MTNQPIPDEETTRSATATPKERLVLGLSAAAVAAVSGFAGLVMLGLSSLGSGPYSLLILGPLLMALSTPILVAWGSAYALGRLPRTGVVLGVIVVLGGFGTLSILITILITILGEL